MYKKSILIVRPGLLPVRDIMGRSDNQLARALAMPTPHLNSRVTQARLIKIYHNIFITQLWLPREINFKFPLQPHQKRKITQYGELGFSELPQMKDDHTTNSHSSLIHFSLQMCCENVVYVSWKAFCDPQASWVSSEPHDSLKSLMLIGKCKPNKSFLHMRLPWLFCPWMVIFLLPLHYISLQELSWL